MWRTALLIPQLDRAVAGLRELGVELVSDPQTMVMGPGLPELRFVCFRGPDHEVIELIEQPATALMRSDPHVVWARTHRRPAGTVRATAPD